MTRGSTKILFALAAILPILLIAFSSLQNLTFADEIYRFKRMWPTLQQPWYFSLPSDVAVDSDGNIYIADTDKNRVQKFNAEGYFITGWGGKGGRGRRVR